MRVCVCVCVCIYIRCFRQFLKPYGGEYYSDISSPKSLAWINSRSFLHSTASFLQCWKLLFSGNCPVLRNPEFSLSLPPPHLAHRVYNACSFLSLWNRLHNITRLSILIFCSQLYHCFPRDLLFYTTFHKIWFQLLPVFRYIISVIPTQSFR